MSLNIVQKVSSFKKLYIIGLTKRFLRIVNPFSLEDLLGQKVHFPYLRVFSVLLNWFQSFVVFRLALTYEKIRFMVRKT